MTNERTDHAAEARTLIERYANKPGLSAEVVSGLMQANAVLAMVEQQRIANLIALASSGARGVAEGIHSVDDYLELYNTVSPEILAGLGLEGAS